MVSVTLTVTVQLAVLAAEEGEGGVLEALLRLKLTAVLERTGGDHAVGSVQYIQCSAVDETLCIDLRSPYHTPFFFHRPSSLYFPRFFTPSFPFPIILFSRYPVLHRIICLIRSSYPTSFHSVNTLLFSYLLL